MSPLVGVGDLVSNHFNQGDFFDRKSIVEFFFPLFMDEPRVNGDAGISLQWVLRVVRDAASESIAALSGLQIVVVLNDLYGAASRGLASGHYGVKPAQLIICETEDFSEVIGISCDLFHDFSLLS